jgi:hypothetical protein
MDGLAIATESGNKSQTFSPTQAPSNTFEGLKVTIDGIF